MRILPLIASCAVALLVAACGEEGETTTEGDETDAGPTIEAPVTPEEPAAVPDTSANESPDNADQQSAMEANRRFGRYFGIYGNAPNSSGSFFVSRAKATANSDFEIPPGLIKIESMTDMPPWYMKPVSDTEFEQEMLGDASGEPLKVVFELGPNGRAITLEFKTIFTDQGKLLRLRNLPVEWR